MMDKEDARFQALEQLHERAKASREVTKRGIILILDSLRVHHSNLVKAWVQERKDQLELFYLPSYRPELNHEKRLNADLKQAMGKRVPVRSKSKLRETANEDMAMLLDQNPERVVSYFQDTWVRYAA